MAEPKVLELSVQTFTADKLEIKVKNISGDALSRALSIEFYAPTFLMNSKINDAAKAAATNTKPIGVASLAGVVSGPEDWSVWARRESSDTSVVIALFNDLDQTGNDLETPIKLAAGTEFIIRIPLNPQANRAAVSLVYSYQHGNNEEDKRIDGKLELQSGEIVEWTPDVRLTTNQASPTTITAGNLVKIFWHVKDGVSATLRGPLPGGNSELTLSSDPQADFKISGGSLEIRVVSSMTYILQAEVKGPDGKPNVQVVRMLSFDTKNNKYTYLAPRPRRVLPYGLIEIDWAAWGVKKVIISVSGHTTRTINLTQQTLGRFYEGSGVMRVTATKEINKVPTVNERITLDAPPENSAFKTVEVIPWMPMTTTPEIEGFALGLAVIAPKIALLMTEGLYIAEVGEVDPPHFSEKLAFSKKPNPNLPLMWLALTAVDQRFVGLRMLATNANFEIVPFTLDGNPDEIPPLTLPPEINSLGSSPKVVFDFVGFGGRAYFVVETPKSAGTVRRAYSVAFDSKSKKADLRPEPLLEPLIGYRLVSFDDGLYALNRDSGRMFRFDLTKTGTLEQPKKAAGAVKKGEGAGAKEESMIKDGLLAPVGRLLVVLSPTSVPSVASLEGFGLQNTLRHSSSPPSSADIPQDLVYNPQKDYWARCGHDLDVKADAKAAFRGGESVRLWVIQPDNRVQTLAAGEETLFAPDYVFDFPSKPLPPYLNKKRQFKITNNTGLQLLPLNEVLRKAGLRDFGIAGPAELVSALPENFRSGTTETFEFKYNDADPVPINLRFQVPRKDGVKHYYLLELTFSGPDLSTAKSVFQRVVVNEQGSVTSIAEIPGTALQHSTNGAVVIPPPRQLVEGVKLRAGNRTTIQLWREAPEAKDRLEVLNHYLGDEIKITHDTPAFFFSAYGAGQLHVNIDFALPVGIEISPSSQPQQKLIRINTDKSNGLHPELLPAKDETTYLFKIGYLLKQELQAVYIGDGVATEKGDAIYLPVAHNSVQVITQVWKINPDNLSTSATTNVQIQSTGVFSTPNSIALSNDFIFAMFGDTDIHVLDYSLQVQAKVSVADAYTVVTGIKCVYENSYSLLGFKKGKGTTQNITFNHVLGTKLIIKSSGPGKVATGNVREVVLDTVKGFREQHRMAGFPPWVSSKTVSPMALSTSNVSPGGDRVREAAVCIDGGLFVVGFSDRPIRVLALESAGREEDVVFGREGKSIYCLHSQGDNQGLRLSRVDNHAWKQTHGLSLPRGEGVADLTTDTRQRTPGTPYKNQRSAGMVISRDEKWLFVSHGRSIFKIEVEKMELRDTYQTELPCRVFHVWSGKPTESHIVYGTPLSCILLYAIGASYRGDGFQGKEFKTHLYKLAIPDQ
jgi:hypothetical protein